MHSVRCVLDATCSLQPSAMIWQDWNETVGYLRCHYALWTSQTLAPLLHVALPSCAMLRQPESQ